MDNLKGTSPIIDDKIAQIIVQLNRLEHMTQWLAERLANPPPPITIGAPGATPMAVNPTWPWEPATLTQGFLAGRYERRDGTSYGAAATQDEANLNSPIAGGDDAQAPSGEPRTAERDKLGSDDHGAARPSARAR